MTVDEKPNPPRPDWYFRLSEEARKHYDETDWSDNFLDEDDADTVVVLVKTKREK